MVNKNKMTPYLLVLPAIMVLLFMVGYPLIFGVNLSFTNMSLRHFRVYSYNGIKNFIDLFSNPTFYSTTLRTFYWTAVNVLFHVMGGLFFALLLNRKLPGKTFFRVVLMIPWAIPQYIAVITWKNMFRGQYGTIDMLLNKLHISGISWLSDPEWTFRAAIITNIWLGIPFMMAIILGGLQSIPHEIYEAGEIDGVRSFNKHRYLTLPLLKPVLTPAIILGTVWTFNMVNVIFIMSQNVGSEQTNILVTRVYKDAFTYFAYGKASAMSVVIFLMLAMSSLVVLRAMKAGKGEYE